MDELTILRLAIGELFYRYRNCPGEIDSLFDAWEDDPFIIAAVEQEKQRQEDYQNEA